jgi:hypothetical protein
LAHADAVLIIEPANHVVVLSCDHLGNRAAAHQ